MKLRLPLTLFLIALGSAQLHAADSLPTLEAPPQNLTELWGSYDPRKEPLEVEITREWEQDGIVCRVVRYQVGTFKGAPAKVAGFFAVPKNAKKIPGLVQIHGGGQSANLESALTQAKLGYACFSINWGGNKMNLGKDGIYEGPNTDWGALDATHPPQRNPINHFAGGIEPDAFTLDPFASPRNSNWFLVSIAGRRALTFLEQQPEVDPLRLGVYGHSMGGRLTTHITGIDKRVKAAVPSCGGSGDVPESAQQPGGSKSKLSALELATVSENPAIESLSAPTLWLSPTNDFHAHIDNMAFTWRNVPDDLLRLSISPHFNHRHTPESALTQHLWFEEHLKGLFKMPKTPKLAVNLKTPDAIPSITVTPDSSLPIQSVDIYYSTDPHGLTRFWRDAHAKKSGTQWTATAPLLSLEQPLFAFANVIYATPKQYRNLPQAPGGANSDVFALSTRETYLTPAQLSAARVKATDQPQRLLDDGARGWQDWYQLNWGNPSLWSVVTRKPKDPKWRGPDGAKLVFEINPKADSTLVITANSNKWGAFLPGPGADFYTIKNLKGSPAFQTVSVTLEELRASDPKSQPLANWQTLTGLTLSPSITVIQDGQKLALPGLPWKDAKDTQIRNLRWEGGLYPSIQTPSSALSPEQLQNEFNNAIKKSLEQEKLDRK